MTSDPGLFSGWLWSAHYWVISAFLRLSIIISMFLPYFQAGYDTELQALHEMVQQKVSILLSDPDNIVKQTLLEKGITRLCVFFGRQKGNAAEQEVPSTAAGSALCWLNK